MVDLTKQTDTYEPNGLEVQGYDLFGATVTIVSGQTVAKGAVLGQITTGGKYALALAASSDGSEDPVAILAEACDASAGDKSAYVYFTGGFRERALVFGTGITAAAFRRTLAQKGIFIIGSQPK